jgi:hypothetical protein
VQRALHGCARHTRQVAQQRALVILGLRDGHNQG